MLIYNNKIVCNKKLESPSVIKIEFQDNTLVNIDKY